MRKITNTKTVCTFIKQNIRNHARNVEGESVVKSTFNQSKMEVMSILDAERHRRTPRLSATWGRRGCTRVLDGRWPLQCATLAETSKKEGDILQTCTKMAPQFHPKPNIKVASQNGFCERFGVGKVVTIPGVLGPFWSQL